jgi:predicted Fe-Mo cluster-binding NifX family protein
MLMRVAIPHHDDEVAPCFEYSAHFTIFSVNKNKVVAQTEFTLQSQKELDRVRLLRDQGVSVLICHGIQDAFEGLLPAAGIRVFSWVSGTVSEVLGLFLEDKLISGSARPGRREECLPQHQKMRSSIHEKEK